MSQILNDNEIKLFKRDGAVFLRNKFDIKWNTILKGISKSLSSASSAIIILLLVGALA